MTVIVAAYNEEPVIERRLENLLALDYPADRLELVVTSDASTDRTHELVERFGDRVRLIVNPRGGKVAAQNRAVRETTGEIVAFSDANATWAPDALRQLVANFADPGRRVRLRPARARGGRRLEPRRASTGATRWRSARRSRGSARSPAATARSTRSAAPTTSRSTRSGATTSPSRTGWCRRAGGRSTSPPRARSRSRRRRTRPSTGARCACSSTAGRSRCAARC